MHVRAAPWQAYGTRFNDLVSTGWGRENGEAAGHTEGLTDMDVDGAAPGAAAALAGNSAAAASPGRDAAAALQVAPAQVGADSSLC